MKRYGSFSFDVAKQWLKDQLKSDHLKKQHATDHAATHVLVNPNSQKSLPLVTEVFKGIIVELDEHARRVDTNGRLYETCALTLEDDEKISHTLIGYELSRVIKLNHLQVGDCVCVKRERREFSLASGRSTVKRYKNHYVVERICD